MTTHTAESRVPFKRGQLLEPPFSRSEKDFRQIRLETHQNGLGLGIAEAHIELEDFGPLVRDHQSGVEDASKGTPLPLHRMHRRHEDFFDNFIEQLRRYQGRRRIGAHPPVFGP